MANIAFSYNRGSAQADRAHKFFSGLLRRYADYRLFHRTYAELQDLSDRELNDLGLGRSDLLRVAQESVYGA